MDKNSLHMQEYVWDFAKDGGAVGEIDLSAKANNHEMPAGAIVRRVIAKVETLCVGVGASLAWGYVGTPNADHAAEAVAGLVADALFFDAGDRLVASGSDEGKVAVDISGAPLTAGKVRLVYEYYSPGSKE